MFDLRAILPATPAMIRAYLIGFVDRVMPINPDPAGWGQPQISPMAFSTDATLRPQTVPLEIEAAGGFAVGLEMAKNLGGGRVQPVGPVIVFIVVPLGHERSELRIVFPLGETEDSRRRVLEELKQAWPGEAIYRDQAPWWLFQEFDRRALSKAIATGDSPPPGAPLPCANTLPWRGGRAQASNLPSTQTGHNIELTPQEQTMVRLWTRERKTAREIAESLSPSPSRVRNRLSELRRILGEDAVPNRARVRLNPSL